MILINVHLFHGFVEMAILGIQYATFGSRNVVSYCTSNISDGNISEKIRKQMILAKLKKINLEGKENPMKKYKQCKVGSNCKIMTDMSFCES